MTKPCIYIYLKKNTFFFFFFFCLLSQIWYSQNFASQFAKMSYFPTYYMSSNLVLKAMNVFFFFFSPFLFYALLNISVFAVFEKQGFVISVLTCQWNYFRFFCFCFVCLCLCFVLFLFFFLIVFVFLFFVFEKTDLFHFIYFLQYILFSLKSDECNCIYSQSNLQLGIEACSLEILKLKRWQSPEVWELQTKNKEKQREIG